MYLPKLCVAFLDLASCAHVIWPGVALLLQCGLVVVGFGVVSVAPHCFTQLSSASAVPNKAFLFMLVPGCCWAWSFFSVDATLCYTEKAE